MELEITDNDKLYLRELAKKYNEYSNLDVMEERTALWNAHNQLKSEKPLVVMENLSFNSDFLPELNSGIDGCHADIRQDIPKQL